MGGGLDMMDDKKIEDAAKQHSEESYISDYFQACYKDAFMECAKWMQEEFLKDLWHPASEEPEIKDVNIAYLDKHGLLEALYFERSPIENWDEKVSIYQIDKWTYLSDLLPKKGGNQ